MSDNPFDHQNPITAENPDLSAGREAVPDEVLEKALKLVQAVAKGNGLRGLQVALGEFEGAVLTFEAYEVFHMDPQINEKRVSGKQNGEVAGSTVDMRSRMQAALSKVSENPDVKRFTIDMLRKRLDLGFALNGQSIALSNYNKNYVVHELCTSCGGRKYMLCGVCHGDGRAKCYRCKGAMQIDCPLCHGQRTVAAGNARKTCTKCNGNGKVGCSLCNGKGVTKCKNCKGDGRLNCQSCHTTGWHSVIGSLLVKAKCSFWYDKEALVAAENAPELPPVIDALGPRMVTEKHADISFIEDIERLKQLDQEVKPDEYKIPYRVRLPWGNISFRLKDKVVNGKLFGYNPALYHVDPFLEEPLIPGIHKLEEAGRTRGDAVQNIKDASRFRALGEALVLSARMSHGRAFEAYEKRYPFGLRTDTLHNILNSADAALKNVTRRPRQRGVLYSAILSLALLGGFYLTPVRAQLYAQLAADPARLALDAVMLATVMAASWFVIQAAATKALHDAMAHLLPPAKRKKLAPKPGRAGYVGGALAFALWLAVVPLTYLLGQSAPLWFERLMALAG